MHSKAEYLTAIQQDWTAENLIGLQSILNAAYAKAGEVASLSREPAFGTPNWAFLAGAIRWSFVDYYLERGCAIGTLTGINATWVPMAVNGGGLQGLELRGMRTSVLAHRLQQPGDPPRESDLRFERRLLNYRNPMLPGLGDEEEASVALINLTLVHGDRGAEFAYLRVYDNPENLRSYLRVSDNLMLMPALVEPVEVEEVPAPALGLKPGVAKGQQEAGGR
jgi:hypothetical protein